MPSLDSPEPQALGTAAGLVGESRADRAEELASEFYAQGYHCGESVVKAINEIAGEPLPAEVMRMASGFCEGLGGSRCVCGALAGGVMATGILSGREVGDRQLGAELRCGRGASLAVGRRPRCRDLRRGRVAHRRHAAPAAMGALHAARGQDRSLGRRDRREGALVLAAPGAATFGYATSMTALIEIARATIARHAMLPDGAPVLVMVSGGGDSVALLRLLASAELGEHPLRVLHVNHLLRAEQSDADERFVVDLCGSLGVECRTVRYDVAGYAQAEHLNLEDAGRRVRYRFAEEELDAWCAELGEMSDGGRIAVAHTRDDRVETFFMRAIAGSGTGALNALAPVRGRVVRPLVDCDRADVRAWLESVGQRWREDPTNSDTSRARALVRAELMPVAERLNPGVRSAVVRTMELLGDDDALLSTMAAAFARDFAHSEPGERVAFERQWMRTLDRAMARRTIRSALIDAFPQAARLEASHVDALVTGLGSDDFARDLPEGLRAETEYGNMVVSCTGVEAPRVAPSLLTLPGSADLGPAGRITAEKVSPDITTGDGSLGGDRCHCGTGGAHD